MPQKKVTGQYGFPSDRVCLHSRRGVQPLGREDPLEEAWQPTPAFLPGESHGQRSLEGYNP